MFKVLDDAASHEPNIVDLKLYPLPVHSLFASNFCLSTLQPANWTLKIDVIVLHFDGMITNHKEIGLGHLLSSCSKLTGVSPDGVTPGPSRDTLMGLHYIH